MLQRFYVPQYTAMFLFDDASNAALVKGKATAAKAARDPIEGNILKVNRPLGRY